MRKTAALTAKRRFSVRADRLIAMRKVYSAANLQDAYLLLHRLERAGIEARVLNEHAHGGVGEIPFTHAYPEVWLVEPADAERAVVIVKEHEHERATPAEAARACRICREDNPGNFDVCWRCGAPLEK